MRALPTDLSTSEIQLAIRAECDALKDMLVQKNKKYGNSVFEPKRLFAKHVGTVDQILVRADDKLSRIANGSLSRNDIGDLAGYLIILLVALDFQTEGEG